MNEFVCLRMIQMNGVDLAQFDYDMSFAVFFMNPDGTIYGRYGTRNARPDEADRDFFLYDLSWYSLSRGDVDPGVLHAATGIAVTDLDSLDEAMAALFAAEAGRAVAVKTQHAYARTLLWQERSRAEAAAALQELSRARTRQAIGDRPPLTQMHWPVTNDASSLA